MAAEASEPEKPVSNRSACDGDPSKGSGGDRPQDTTPPPVTDPCGREKGPPTEAGAGADPQPSSSDPTSIRLTPRQVEVLTHFVAGTVANLSTEGRRLDRTLDSLSDKSLIVEESSAVMDAEFPYRITDEGKKVWLAIPAPRPEDDDRDEREPEEYWPQVGDHVRSNDKVPPGEEFEGCVKEVIRRRKALLCVRAGVRIVEYGPIHRSKLQKVDDQKVICQCGP